MSDFKKYEQVLNEQLIAILMEKDSPIKNLTISSNGCAYIQKFDKDGNLQIIDKTDDFYVNQFKT